MSWEQTHAWLTDVALSRGDLGGYPMPLDGHTMTLAPGFKYSGIGEMGREEPELADEEKKLEIINEWFSLARGRMVIVYRKKSEPGAKPNKSKVALGKPTCSERAGMLIASCHATLALRPDAERKALASLASHVSDTK